MTLFTIALKSLKQRMVPTSLTALSVALGVALMIAVLVINGVVSRMFTLNGTGYDLIVGPKGSKLDLVLNSIYRIVPPIENLPYRYYEELKKDPRIEKAIPLLLGDGTNEGNFPILGTTNEYFALPYAQDNKGKDLKFKIKGALPAEAFDAVIGSQVAKENGWDVGYQFPIVHGGQDGHLHDEKFTVTAVLKRTGTPNDRTVFVNLKGFFAIGDHGKPVEEAISREAEFFGETKAEVEARYADLLPAIRKAKKEGAHYHGVLPDLQKEVTSILIQIKRDPKRPGLELSRARKITSELQEGFKAQAVNPIAPLKKLMTNLVGNVRSVLMYLTGLIIAVSGIGIFVSIYNSMAERKREIAIMRALGADRSRVFSIILMESILLCLGGGLLGFFLGHGIIFIASPIIASKSGIIIDPFTIETIELAIIPIMLGLAILVGFIPALTAYKTDVADNL